jgi:hypothetical protein
MGWKEVVEVWDRAVAKAGRGQRANLGKLGEQAAVRHLAALDLSQVLARAELMLAEEWREYCSISALWSSWEVLGEKVAKRERERAINSQAVGNPPTKTEEIRRIWAEPHIRAGDEAHAELVEWLRKQMRGG